MFRGKFSLIAGIILIGGFFVSANANQIAINDIAVWSKSTINLGTGVTINGISASGTGLNANSNSRLNSIYTQGNAWLGSYVSVNGNITSNGQAQFDKTVKVSGQVNNYSNFVLPALDTLQKTTIGKESINTKKDAQKTLLPGDYSSWNFDRNNTINLSAGNYSISSFWMNTNGVVNVDTSAGDVVLNVNGAFSTGSGVAFNKTGKGNFYVNVIGSTMYLNDNVSLSGIVKVSGGTFGTGTGANLTGQLFSTGDVWFGNNSQFTYQAAAMSIPEPSTMVILAAMSFAFRARRKATINTSAAE